MNFEVLKNLKMDIKTGDILSKNNRTKNIFHEKNNNF